MSSVQKLDRVLEDELPPRGSDRLSTRLPGPSSDTASWDPVIGLVHDLRSPLTSILVLSETLMRDASRGVGDRQRRQLTLLHGAALGLTALLTDIVDIADVGDEVFQREPAPFGVGEVIESVADTVRPLAEAKGLTVRTLCPAHDRRLGHRLALRRVLLNLTTNALKFTAEGHVEIAAAPHADGRLPISVRDTGHGLPPSVIEALARPLTPSPAADGHPLRAGNLGLTICRRLLRCMGSELEFETWPGRGTRFHFALDLPSALVT
jgi:signal transduction histidine kinase